MEEPGSTVENIWPLNLTPIATASPHNSSHGFFGENSPYTTTESILIAVVLGFIIVGTIIGNILVCVTVCLVKKLRRPCNYLLVSLAVSDLCVATLVMPMALIYEILGSWTFGRNMCNIWVSFDVLCCTASIYNLCMISIDRYNAITRPLEYGVKRTPLRMIVYVSLVWIFAACISIPLMLILGNEHGEVGSPHCIVCQNFWYQIYATAMSFYIPLIVMIYVYYKIYHAARRIVLEEKRAQSHLEAHCYLAINSPHQMPAPGLNRQSNTDIQTGQATSPMKQHRSSSASTTCSSQGVKCFAAGPRRSNESQCPMLSKNELPISSATTTPLPVIKSTIVRNHLNSSYSLSSSPHKKKLRFQLAKERKASITLGIIMTAFTICWLPFFVLALIRSFSKETELPQSLTSFFLWLGYCNSLLNPIIYATLNRDFRKPFREILFFRCYNLNNIMREEFYQSQYGDPVNNYVVRSADVESAARPDNPVKDVHYEVPKPPNESFL